MNKGISIIIPLYNEAEGITYLVEALNDFFSKYRKNSIEIIFVNDGSIDNTTELIKNQHLKRYNCKLINLSR